MLAYNHGAADLGIPTRTVPALHPHRGHPRPLLQGLGLHPGGLTGGDHRRRGICPEADSGWGGRYLPGHDT